MKDYYIEGEDQYSEATMSKRRIRNPEMVHKTFMLPKGKTPSELLDFKMEHTEFPPG